MGRKKSLAIRRTAGSLKIGPMARGQRNHRTDRGYFLVKRLILQSKRNPGQGSGVQGTLDLKDYVFLLPVP